MNKPVCVQEKVRLARVAQGEKGGQLGAPLGASLVFPSTLARKC